MSKEIWIATFKYPNEEGEYSHVLGDNVHDLISRVGNADAYRFFKATEVGIKVTTTFTVEEKQ